MLLRGSLGSRLVLLCLCLWGLANLRLLLTSVREYRDPLARYTPSAIIPRFEPLRQWLPDGTVVGYLLDEENADLHTHHPESRFSLALYTLAPRTIRRTTACPLVIVDGNRPEVAAEDRPATTLDARGRPAQRRAAVPHSGDGTMIAWLLAGIVVPWFAAYALVRRCDAGARNAPAIWLHGILRSGWP